VATQAGQASDQHGRAPDHDRPAGPELARLLHQLRRREARRRSSAELTYREIAARTGWSLGIVAQYFSGKTLPPVDRFDELVRLLGASPAEQGRLATARDRVDEQRRGLAGVTARAAPTRRADLRVLGPVEVLGPGGRAALVGRRQRALVGLLALSPGQVVSQARLVDALWGEAPPRTAVQTLYSHVARVRRALDGCGLPGLLAARDSGYALAVAPDDVDADRFERAVRDGRRALADGRVAQAAAVLQDAVALWRGDALADTGPAGWAAAAVERLHDLRLSAYEDLWDCRLRQGEHAVAAGELEKLLVAHPGRERLVELLMLALYRDGRHAEAIEAYQRLRVHLAEHLGVGPSPRLAGVYSAMLRRDSELDTPTRVVPPGSDRTAAPAGRGHPAPGRGQPMAVRPERPSGAGPAQLPPEAGHFTGRRAEMAVLDGLLGRRSRVGLVCGPAGMGKTALAVRWAHRVAGRFPDGQLFLDLRGHDPGTTMPATEVLAHLLRGLDVPASRIPADPAELVSRYRSAMYGRRVLVVLDNASDVDQVTSLAPPSSGSLLLVTSRRQLAGLAVDHAVSTVDLDVLPADDSVTLLRRVLGAERVAGESDAAAELADLCGGMPLALRIAAAKLTIRPPRTIADLVSDLAGLDRLATLAVAGDTRSIRTVFASAYQALSLPAAGLFRRLGHHPGATFTRQLAAALASEGPAGEAVDELVDAHLVTEQAGGRYRFHDLIRLYAAERATPEEIAGTATRVTDWYLAVADAANRVLDPVRDRAGPVEVDPPVVVPFPADRAAALAFLDAERGNLLNVVGYAARTGHDRAVWRLAYLLTSYHALRGHWPTQVAVCRYGLAATRRLGDEAAEALLRSLLGLACHSVRRYEEALSHLERALELARAQRDWRGQGMALNNMALAFSRLGRRGAAIDAFHQALTAHNADNHPQGIALVLNNLGHEYTLDGDPGRALDHLTRALDLARELRNPALEAMTLDSIGQARLAAGDPDGALEHLSGALAIRRRTGERRSEADTLTLIALTHRGRGDHQAAATRFREVLGLSRELGDRDLEATTLGHLRALPPAVRIRPARG
jgi:DNA-binding SARP family transcriptional activator/Tfp pilus assembly protein PilF